MGEAGARGEWDGAGLLAISQEAEKRLLADARDGLRTGNWAKAVLACESLVALDRGTVETYFNLAWANLMIGRQEACAAAISEASALDPKGAGIAALLFALVASRSPSGGATP